MLCAIFAFIFGIEIFYWIVLEVVGHNLRLGMLHSGI
jgi:hypothetical protein